MKYQTAQTEIQILSGRLHHLLLISTGLLIANIFLVWLASWAFLHQKRTIVPAEIRQSFTISDSVVDASYLQQMALMFVSQRLNITPSNIDHNHGVILQYTDHKFYHALVGILAQEKQAVLKQNISAVFYPEQVIPNVQDLSVMITGSLVHWVGAAALAPVKKTYIIRFTYQSGILKVRSFTMHSDAKDASELTPDEAYDVKGS